MKKAVCIALSAFLVLCCISCGQGRQQQEERSHLYWKDIEAVVTDVERQHFFAATHWYIVTVTVSSKEYGVSGTFTYQGAGIFDCPKQWWYKVGEQVTAQLYSWVMDSSGEVVRRKINRIYE